MRLIIPTTTLFTVAFLATLMSNTESANLANAKLALGLTTDDMPPTKGAENPESMEEPVTKVSLSAPESSAVMEFATNPEQNRDTTEQIVAKSMRRDLERVREIRLEGQSRSPVFIPEFSAASPWANVAPDETINAAPVSNHGSLARAMPPAIFPRTTVARSPLTLLNKGGTGPRSHSVPEIIERPAVKVEIVRPGSGGDRLPVPEPPPNSARAAASVPAISNRVQPSSLPALSSGESTLVATSEPVQISDRPRQGSAKDLLPVGGAESVTPSNSSQTVAAVQPPDPVTPLTRGVRGDSGQRIAQTGSNIYRPNPQDVQLIQEQVQNLQENAVVDELIEGSPSLTIVNPTGYGADNNTGYLSGTYQSRVRNTESDDAAFALGFGFGDARETLGVELSYTFASLGTRRDFGTGGFNVKLHRQFANDWAVAAGWNGFVSTGDYLDGFEDSVYGVVSKVIRTQESINSPFSRIALSAGVGNGQFRSADALDNGEDGVNVFGTVAVRVAKPVSAIAEWTGQDLTVGASIAPFKNVPFTITPAVRDIAGTGDGARFVLGAGVGFRF